MHFCVCMCMNSQAHYKFPLRLQSTYIILGDLNKSKIEKSNYPAINNYYKVSITKLCTIAHRQIN